MWQYLLQRLFLMIPTVVGVLTLTFVVTQFVPGGPVEHALSLLDQESSRSGGEGSPGASGWTYSGRERLDAKQIQALEKTYGFDRPPFERYVDMLGRFARFDLGESYFRNASVGSLLRSKLGVSMSIGAWVFFITYLVSIPLGIAKAVRAGSRFDLFTSLLVLGSYAVPGFVLGVLLIVLFGGGSFWDLFPLRGLTSDNWSELGTWDRLADYAWHATLPVIASVVGTFAVKTLLTKNSFLDEIGKQYVVTALAKGLPRHRVLYKHVLRNAVLPIVTSFPGAFVSAFFTGSLLIETLFSLDGLGLLSYESINSRDYPVVLGALYVFTLVGLATKLLGDVAYAIVDPRIRFDARGAS
ncbi:MAG TPA: ABC transporter permease subunit [Polyangiaceae bacterium]|nr:ABC transporter permease subunit [Polyangiaceae bacterium]